EPSLVPYHRCWLLIAFSVSCHGPSQPAPCLFPTPPKSGIASRVGRGTIEGHVFQIPGAIPAKGALIELQPGGILASTDSAGFFRVNPVKQGHYRIRVRGLGLKPALDSITNGIGGVEVVAVLAADVIADYECVVSGQLEKRSRRSIPNDPVETYRFMIRENHQ